MHQLSMDNEENISESDSFAESVSDECFHDSVDARKENAEFSDGENDDEGKENQPRTDLVGNLRNAMITACVKSDDETSEKLSAVIEQPEEHFAVDAAAKETNECQEDPNKDLRERIASLQDVMIGLREQLRRELTLWRKERNEFQLLRERSDIRALEEATAAARAAAEAYAAESPLSNEIGDVVNLNPVQSITELTILEYEKELAKYQDALALAQAEKRYNMRRQLIGNSYQRRLLEVERSCNEEFEKICESANILRSLRCMTSQWCVQDGDGIHSDTIRESDPDAKSYDEGEKKTTANIVCDKNTSKFNKVDEEIQILAEAVASQFIHPESSRYDRYAKASRSCTLIESSSSSPSNWYASSTNCQNHIP